MRRTLCAWRIVAQARRRRHAPPPSRLPSAMRTGVSAVCVHRRSPALGPAPRRPAAAAPSARTMRVDYFHTGNTTQELFSLDQVVDRAGGLAGRARPRRRRAAARRLRLRRARRGHAARSLYSRGFGSIYDEWVTTEEAATVDAHVPRVAALPGARGAGDRERPQARPGQPVDDGVDHDGRPRGHVRRHRGARSRRRRAHRDRAARRSRAQGGPAAARRRLHRGRARQVRGRRAAARRTSCSPRRRSRSAAQDFNVWGLVPPARESGISRPSLGVHRANPVGATYDAFGSERYVLTFDNRAFRRLASFAPYDVVEIVVNGRTYGGGGIYNQYSTVAADNAFAPYVFVHEFGHHFAALADEYYTSPVAYLPSATREEPWEPNVTALLDPAQPQVEGSGARPARRCRRRGTRTATRSDRARRRPRAPSCASRGGRRPRWRRCSRASARMDDAQFGAEKFAGQRRRVRGRQVRGARLLPARGQLHHVHARRASSARCAGGRSSAVIDSYVK